MEMTEKNYDLWQHITANRDANAKNARARALFSAIQAATTVPPGFPAEATVNFELVTCLAACAYIALQYDKDDEIPLSEDAHERILDDLMAGFVHYLTIAVRSEDKKHLYHVNAHKKEMVGYFMLPDLFSAGVRER